MKLVVGLGNPGVRYEGTRHNVGAEVVELLAENHGGRFRRKWRLDAWMARVTISGRMITLARPRLFMNLSGIAVAKLMRWEKASIGELLVVVDDAALPLGAIRLRSSGSAGGHNGLASVINHLRSDRFPRLRVGIGTARGGLVPHVLGVFTAAEREIVDGTEERAVKAIEEVVTGGIQAAMDRWNG